MVSATSDSGTYRLEYPTPLDGAIITGMSNRTLKHRLVNLDPYTSFEVEIAAPAVNRLSTYWRTGYTDATLAPGDEMLIQGSIVGNRIDLDQTPRVASWAEIAVVAGSGGSGTGNTRSMLNVVEGDLIMVAALRTPGLAISTPAGKGYVGFTTAPFDADSKLLSTDRSYKIVYAFATATGTYSIGNFTNAGRVWSVAFRNVASVGKYNAAVANSASLAYPTLTNPFSPEAHLVGFTARLASSYVKPAGATDADAANNTAAAATSGVWWTMGEQSTTHAPAALAQTATEWASAVFELRPKRLN